MMMDSPKILGISDVSIGYGSPIIPAFLGSLAEHYRVPRAHLLEPDQPEVPPQHDRYPVLSVTRIRSSFHPHKHSAGRVEYVLRACKEVEKLRPDILVVFCTYAIPVLFKLKWRPRFVIYYAVELTSPYGDLDVGMGRNLGGLVDLVIYPEENRAVIEAKVCGIRLPSAILYNCVNPPNPDPTAIARPDGRNGRILYSGTIDWKQTCFAHFASSRLRDAPVDFFGLPSGITAAKTKRQLGKLRGELRYMGRVDGKTLGVLRKEYAYSLVVWKPLDDNHFYAAPNKFFEALASGVPVITAPHPQCKTLVERYGCGIVLRDWSLNGFVEGIQQAVRMAPTERFGKMVEGCLEAVRKECNWEAQFAKVIPLLPT